MTIEVLHVIQQLSWGGASQALTALATAAQHSRHQVVSLIPATPTAGRRLREQAIPLMEPPSNAQLDTSMREADVVQLHFWNTPELYAVMTAEHTCRLVIWSHVEGSTAPHMLIPELEHYAQVLVHTCSTPDPSAITIAPRSPHHFAAPKPAVDEGQPLRVGIFGSLSSSRMCPEALDVFAQTTGPDSHLRVVG